MTTPQPPRAFCCEPMHGYSTAKCEEHRDEPALCSDVLVVHSERHGPGLPIHVDGGGGMIVIEFCPWCGTRIGDGAGTATPADTCVHGRLTGGPCQSCRGEGVVPRTRDRIMLTAEWRTLIHNVHKVGEGWHWRCGVAEFRTEECQYDQSTDSYDAMIEESLWHLRRYHDVTRISPAARTPGESIAANEHVAVEEPGVLWMAMRYALGRATYAVGEVGDAIERHADSLEPGQRQRMAAEIAAAIAEGRAGMDMDVAVWRRAVHRLVGEEPGRSLLAGGEQQ